MTLQSILGNFALILFLLTLATGVVWTLDRFYLAPMRRREASSALAEFDARSARLMEKVLKSAVGNARFKEIEDVEELVVVESRVDGGPVLKRSMPRARGSAYPIMKRLSHIHVGLGF